MRKYRNLIITLSIIVLISAISFIANTLIARIKYDSPQESFAKSASRGSELVEQDDVALIIYKKSKNILTNTVADIYKTEKGWTSLKLYPKNLYNKSIDTGSELGGIVFIDEIFEGYCVYGWLTDDENVNYSISDSISSDFSVCTDDKIQNLKSTYFVTKLDYLPDDYYILINDEKIYIKN